jgi:Flp pilus assembly protein TadD
MLQRGNKDKAIDQFEQAATVDPTYAAPRIFLGNLLLAKKDPKSLQQAAEHFAAAVKLAPEDVTAHTGSGEVLLELGKIEEARAAFRKPLD